MNISTLRPVFLMFLIRVVLRGRYVGVATWISAAVDSTSQSTAGPVNTWTGDRLLYICNQPAV